MICPICGANNVQAQGFHNKHTKSTYDLCHGCGYVGEPKKAQPMPVILFNGKLLVEGSEPQ